ncbi:MAG: HlyD family efflux transporter periplasmic adaptor subunit [Patescibacteria group bacterium]|nr:HlyD family efflux transporter periplasmic adaptor subunit [Patescibacteria group bacterium]
MAKKFLSRHKFSLIVVILIVLAIAGYSIYKVENAKTAKETRYVLTAVEKGTITSYVSGTGQVSASQQLDIKAKASGDIVYLAAKNSQEVKEGALLAQLDSTDAQKSVRDAQTNLESAELSLKKLKEPADALSLLQAENSLLLAQEAKQNAQDALNKAYEDSFNDVANGFLDLPTIMTGLENIFFEKTLDQNQENIAWYVNQASPTNKEKNKADLYKNDFYDLYQKAVSQYNSNFEHYKSASRSSGQQAIEDLINETYETSKTISDTVKAAKNYVDFVENAMEQRKSNIPALVATHQTTLDTYTGTINGRISNLLDAKTAIENSKQTIANSDQSIAEKIASLAKLKAGADELDIQSQELNIRQKENALADAQEKLADYFVRAPFTGTVAAVNVKKGDPVSSGTVIATLLTKQMVAEITLNEVDVAKAKVGQKATLAFDALPDLTLAGQVAEIDSIGTVSQGVVSYTVKITFAAANNGNDIKPGMSISANIITDIKTDVLMAPNSAVKSQGSNSYVEVPEQTEDQAQLIVNANGVVLAQPPKQQTIETGISNDTYTEIVSGLAQGDLVVSGTVSVQTSKTAPAGGQQNSLFRIGGGGR